MQEEVTQKTIALYVKVGKGAARLTEQALQKAIQKFLEQKSKPAHGKQTMRQLMKQNAGVSNIEITDSNIKAFESTAKKYNIDFSLKKVKGEQTRYKALHRPGFPKQHHFDADGTAYHEQPPEAAEVCKE